MQGVQICQLQGLCNQQLAWKCIWWCQSSGVGNSPGKHCSRAGCRQHKASGVQAACMQRKIMHAGVEARWRACLIFLAARPPPYVCQILHVSMQAIVHLLAPADVLKYERRGRSCFAFVKERFRLTCIPLSMQRGMNHRHARPAWLPVVLHALPQSRSRGQ